MLFSLLTLGYAVLNVIIQRMPEVIAALVKHPDVREYCNYMAVTCSAEEM
jgi:hypothetical protein